MPKIGFQGCALALGLLSRLLYFSFTRLSPLLSSLLLLLYFTLRQYTHSTHPPSVNRTRTQPLTPTIITTIKGFFVASNGKRHHKKLRRFVHHLTHHHSLTHSLSQEHKGERPLTSQPITLLFLCLPSSRWADRQCRTLENSSRNKADHRTGSRCIRTTLVSSLSFLFFSCYVEPLIAFNASSQPADKHHQQKDRNCSLQLIESGNLLLFHPFPTNGFNLSSGSPISISSLTL